MSTPLESWTLYCVRCGESYQAVAAEGLMVYFDRPVDAIAFGTGTVLGRRGRRVVNTIDTCRRCKYRFPVGVSAAEFKDRLGAEL